LILAVRTVEKGESAKEDIVGSVKQRTDATAIEIWPLDLSSTESTLAFAERVKKDLPRLDILVENAGINVDKWVLLEGIEQTIQINVLNTFLLALSLLPKMTETKTKFVDSTPHLVILSSEAHRMTKFKEINAPDLYERLNEKRDDFDGQMRYSVSKLIEVLFVRELVSRLSNTKSSTPPVVINMVNPGLCVSSLTRDRHPIFQVLVFFLSRLIGRKTEVGARTEVIAACAGPESHGKFMSDGMNQEVEEWILSDMGKRVQKKVFDQTMKVLETRKPGVGAEVGL